MNLPEELSFSDFGVLIRKKRSYITQLKVQGRLVLTDDGKRVRVAESIRRMADTSDPAKFAVTARHAANRGEGVSSDTVPAAANDPGSSPGDTDPDEDGLLGRGSYSDEKTRRERAMANLAELEYNTKIGKLMAGDDVLAVVSSAMAGLRTRLTGLPDVLGPQLAAITDEGQVRIALADAIEHALAEAARQFQQLAQSEKGE